MKTKQKNPKQNKEGLGPSEVAPRATSPDPQTKTKNSKNKTKTKKNKKKQKQPKNEFFSYQSKLSAFFRVQNFFFDNLAQTARTQKHYKDRASANQFSTNNYRSRNGHCWTPKTQNPKLQVSFFCLFLLIEKLKPQKSAETPFYSVLVNIKKRIFKINSKRANLKNTFFPPNFPKTLFLENCLITGPKNTT